MRPRGQVHMRDRKLRAVPPPCSDINYGHPSSNLWTERGALSACQLQIRDRYFARLDTHSSHRGLRTAPTHR